MFSIQYIMTYKNSSNKSKVQTKNKCPSQRTQMNRLVLRRLYTAFPNICMHVSISQCTYFLIILPRYKEIKHLRSTIHLLSIHLTKAGITISPSGAKAETRKVAQCNLLHPSIRGFFYELINQTGLLAVGFPSQCLRKGRLHPGQVTNPSQANTEKQTTSHTHIHTNSN